MSFQELVNAGPTHQNPRRQTPGKATTTAGFPDEPLMRPWYDHDEEDDDAESYLFDDEDDDDDDGLLGDQWSANNVYDGENWMPNMDETMRNFWRTTYDEEDDIWDSDYVDEDVFSDENDLLENDDDDDDIGLSFEEVLQRKYGHTLHKPRNQETYSHAGHFHHGIGREDDEADGDGRSNVGGDDDDDGINGAADDDDGDGDGDGGGDGDGDGDGDERMTVESPKSYALVSMSMTPYYIQRSAILACIMAWSHNHTQDCTAKTETAFRRHCMMNVAAMMMTKADVMILL